MARYAPVAHAGLALLGDYLAVAATLGAGGGDHGGSKEAVSALAHLARAATEIALLRLGARFGAGTFTLLAHLEALEGELGANALESFQERNVDVYVHVPAVPRSAAALASRLTAKEFAPARWVAVPRERLASADE